MVSQEELDQLREQNKELRERKEEADRALAEQLSNQEREYQASQLLVENARLAADVDAAEARANSEVVDKGSSTLRQSAQEQLEQAKARLEGRQGVPVDTNNPDAPTNDTGASYAVEEGSDEEPESGAPDPDPGPGDQPEVPSWGDLSNPTDEDTSDSDSDEQDGGSN